MRPRKTKYSGRAKMRRAGFQKGCIPHNKGKKSDKKYTNEVIPVVYMRESEDLHRLATNDPDLQRQSASNDTTERRVLLRPTPADCLAVQKCADRKTGTKREAEKSTNRIVQIAKNEESWNTAFREHATKSPNCDGCLLWDLEKEVKWGMACRETIMCSKCDYRSKSFALYEEVKKTGRGRRAAAMNIGAQVVLAQTSTGNAGLRTLLMGSNIPAPSTSGMQKASNKVLDKIVETNEMDMRQRRNKLKTINRLRGRPENEIDTQSDGIYMSQCYTGIGETPFQPANQTVYVVAENITEDHQIIDVETKNKNCSYGIVHTSQEDVDACKCSANISIQQNIGDEYSWAKQSFLKMKACDNLEVRNITTDPDTASYRAALHLHESKITKTVPRNFIDTRHLTQNHRKFVRKSTAILNLMPGRTKAIREKLRGRFSVDLSKRCQAEFETAYKKHCGNTKNIMHGMAQVSKAIVNCYQGNHTLCTRHSYVCGKDKNKTWVEKSSFLEPDFRIKSSSVTKSVLLMCINYRLSKTTVSKTFLNSNTQKCESVNRRIRRSLPKTVTYTRNFHGRAHSSIFASNNGPGEAVVLLCAAVSCPISEGSSVACQLKREQDLFKYRKAYKKSKQSILKRKTKRTFLFRLYEAFREQKLYAQGQILKNIAEQVKSKYGAYY